MMSADPYKFAEPASVPKKKMKKARMKFYSQKDMKQAKCVMHIETHSSAAPDQNETQVKEVSVASVVERHMAFLRVKYPFLLPSQIKGHTLKNLGLPNCMGELPKSIPVKRQAKKSSWMVSELVVNPLAMVNFSLLLRNFVQKLSITERQSISVVLKQSNAVPTQSQSPSLQKQQAQSAETSSDFHISECASDGDIFQRPKNLLKSTKNMKTQKVKPLKVKVKKTRYTKTEVTFSPALCESTTSSTSYQDQPPGLNLTDNTLQITTNNKNNHTLPLSFEFIEKDESVTETYCLTVNGEVSFDVPDCFSSQEKDDYEVGLFKSPKRSCYDEEDDSEMESCADNLSTNTKFVTAMSTVFNVPLMLHEKHVNVEETSTPEVLPLNPLEQTEEQTKIGHESPINSPVIPQVSIAADTPHNLLNNSQSSIDTAETCNVIERNCHSFSPAIVAELESSPRATPDIETDHINLSDRVDQDDLDSILSDHKGNENTAAEVNLVLTTDNLTTDKLQNDSLTMDSVTPNPVKQTANILEDSKDEESNDFQETSNPNQSSGEKTKFRAQEEQIIEKSQDLANEDTSDEEHKENSAAASDCDNIIEDDIVSCDGQENVLLTPKQNKNKTARKNKVSESKSLVTPKVKLTKMSKNSEDHNIQTVEQPTEPQSIFHEDVAEANNEIICTKNRRQSSDGILISPDYVKGFNKKKVSQGRIQLPSSPRPPLLEVTQDSPHSANRMQTRSGFFKIPKTPGGSSDGVKCVERKCKGRKGTPNTVDIGSKRKLFTEIDTKKRASKQLANVATEALNDNTDDSDKDSDLSDLDSILNSVNSVYTPVKTRRSASSSTPKAEFGPSKFSPSISEIESEINMDVIQSNLSDITEMAEHSSKISDDSFKVIGRFCRVKATPSKSAKQKLKRKIVEICDSDESACEQEDELSSPTPHKRIKCADDTKSVASQATEDSTINFCRSATVKRFRRTLNLPKVDPATKVSNYLSGLGDSSSQESYLSTNQLCTNKQTNMAHCQESRKPYVPSECSVASFLVNLYETMSDEEDAATIATNTMEEELSDAN